MVSLHSPNDRNPPTYNWVGPKDLVFFNQLGDAKLPQAPMIAIVDDDESVREATKSFIKSLGYAAETFASAEEFLQSDGLHDASCLIADVQMPGMTGINCDVD
jgi:response regulator RpfG family c-di-GMP phosphodiesterase